jgi:hypothetical protein
MFLLSFIFWSPPHTDRIPSWKMHVSFPIIITGACNQPVIIAPFSKGKKKKKKKKGAKYQQPHYSIEEKDKGEKKKKKKKVRGGPSSILHKWI